MSGAFGRIGEISDGVDEPATPVVLPPPASRGGYGHGGRSNGGNGNGGGRNFGPPQHGSPPQPAHHYHHAAPTRRASMPQSHRAHHAAPAPPQNAARRHAAPPSTTHLHEPQRRAPAPAPNSLATIPRSRPSSSASRPNEDDAAYIFPDDADPVFAPSATTDQHDPDDDDRDPGDDEDRDDDDAPPPPAPAAPRKSMQEARTAYNTDQRVQSLGVEMSTMQNHVNSALSGMQGTVNALLRKIQRLEQQLEKEKSRGGAAAGARDLTEQAKRVLQEVKDHTNWFWGQVLPNKQGCIELYRTLDAPASVPPAAGSKAGAVEAPEILQRGCGEWLRLTYPQRSAKDRKGREFIWLRTSNIDQSTAQIRTYWAKAYDLRRKKNLIANFQFRSPPPAVHSGASASAGAAAPTSAPNAMPAVPPVPPMPAPVLPPKAVEKPVLKVHPPPPEPKKKPESDSDDEEEDDDDEDGEGDFEDAPAPTAPDAKARSSEAVEPTPSTPAIVKF